MPPVTSRRPLLTASFAIYLVLLVWIVMWKLGVPHLGDDGARQLKLVPFVASGGHGGSAPAEVVVNVLLFVPFGLYLGYLRASWPWWRTVLTICGASVAMEVAQYVFAVGSCDVTDVITNTAGGAAGLAAVALIRRSRGISGAVTVRRICLASTALVLAASVAFLASPIRFSGPARPAGCGLQHRGTTETQQVSCALPTDAP